METGILTGWFGDIVLDFSGIIAYDSKGWFPDWPNFDAVSESKENLISWMTLGSHQFRTSAR